MKTHRNCGGKVIWKEPEFDACYERAGYCTKCGEYPITIEDIIFEEEDEEE